MMKFLGVFFLSFLVCQILAEEAVPSYDDVEQLLKELEENPNKSITMDELIPYLYVAHIAHLGFFFEDNSAHHTFCENKLNITASEFSLVKHDVRAHSERYKCFVTCIYEHAGFIKDNEISGKLAVLKKITDMALQKFGHDKDDENVQGVTKINQCFYEPAEGKCDKAFNIMTCLSKVAGFE